MKKICKDRFKLLCECKEQESCFVPDDGDVDDLISGYELLKRKGSDEGISRH